MIPRPQLTAFLEPLSATDRGAPAADILVVLDRLDEAGYSVEVFNPPDRRVYRATDPETGLREQVSTVPGGVTDWRAVMGVVWLWGIGRGSHSKT